MDKGKIRIAIFGGSGYGGSELLRILLFHPNAEIVLVTANEHAGKAVGDVHKNLGGLTDLRFETAPQKLFDLSEIDVAFFALPHGQALSLASQLPVGIKVIDLSGDFRIDDPEVFKKFYKLDHVGDIVDVDVHLVNLLLEGGYLPVISSLGADDEGKIYNINADTIAAEIAVSLKAEKLLLLSDVNGIYADPADESTKINKLTSEEAAGMIADGRATGGMIPKLQNLISLLDRGVRSAHVMSGTMRNTILSEVFTDEGTGTMLVAGKKKTG